MVFLRTFAQNLRIMRTNAIVYPIFLFLASLLIVSCHEGSDALNATFSKIEKCMEVYPDSALDLLKAIPHPEKLQGKSQADYALLMTQAMDKNYMKFSSDSLIDVALNYYTVNRSNPAMRAKTQFYYGRVMLELDDHEVALKSFLAAKSFYDNVKEHKMMALISDEIGMINRIQKMYRNALNNFQVSLSLYRLVEDSLCVVRAYQNIGRIYLFENKWDSCSFYFNRALNIAKQKTYKSEASILHDLGIMYRSANDLSMAEFYFLASFEKEIDEDKKSMECLSLGYLYLQMGKTDYARKYLEMSLKSSNVYTKIDAYNCMYSLERAEANFEKAFEYIEKADSVSDIIKELNSRELIADLQRKYENEKLQKDNLQIKVRYTNFILWGTIAFLIVVFYMCYYYYKNRNNKKRITAIECQITENEEEIKRYQQEFEEILKSKDLVLKENRILEGNRIKMGELNGKIILLTMQNKTLSEQLKEFGGELKVEVTSEQYIPAFRLLLAIREGTLRGKVSNEEREKLFSLFDLLYWNYVSRLLEQSPSLTKHDLEICCLLKFGLKHEDLSYIFHTTSDSVTKAKGRLKGRLGISSQDDLELYLRNF